MALIFFHFFLVFIFIPGEERKEAIFFVFCFSISDIFIELTKGQTAKEE